MNNVLLKLPMNTLRITGSFLILQTLLALNLKNFELSKIKIISYGILNHIGVKMYHSRKIIKSLKYNKF